MSLSSPFQSMKLNVLSALAIAVLLTLAACDKAPGNSGADAAKVASTPVSIAAINVEAKGFTVGAPMSARTVYVFFDSQCPHCTELWEAAKPLKSQAKFVWIPVGLINPSSTAQGATLLAASDPAAAMEAHETSMRARQGGISAGGDIEAQKAIVAKNTELMTRFGFASIPTIVAKHAQTGELVTQEGASPTAALATLLGLEVPVGQAEVPAK
jgi:thiol:disulfide interchange protein DsbG